MRLTDYHAKYFAHELTRRFPPDSVENLPKAPPKPGQLKMFSEEAE